MGRLVFVSYRRQTGYELAHFVDAELRSRGVRTFIDVSESDPGQFWPQIKAGDDWVLSSRHEHEIDV